jgi:hypothetical protein
MNKLTSWRPFAEPFALRHETEKHGKQGMKQRPPTGSRFAARVAFVAVGPEHQSAQCVVIAGDRDSAGDAGARNVTTV